MKTFHLIVFVIFFSLSCTACGQGIERRASVKDAKVEGVVDGSIESVKNKIVEIFTAKYKSRVKHPEDIHTAFLPSANDSSEGLFPPDIHIKASIREDKQSEHADLIEYLKLSNETRKSDVALINFDNRFWYSEYYWNNKPIKYQCSFIIHLEYEGIDKTKIQVLQYEQQIWVGKKFGMGHAGPAYTNDIRLAAPTMKDSADLLEFLKNNLK